MNQKRYRDSFDRIKPPEGFEARVEETVNAHAAQKKNIRRQRRLRVLSRPVAAVVAVVLVLAIGVGTAFAAAAVRGQSLKSETVDGIAANAEASLAAEIQALLDGDTVHWATDTFLDTTVAAGEYSFTLTEMLRYDQEEPDYFIFLTARLDDAPSNAEMESAVWTLTVNGNTTESRDTMCYDWEDGYRYVAWEFPFEGTFAPGVVFKLSGSPADTRMESEFTFTQEQAEAKRRDTARVLVEYDRESGEIATADLSDFPDEAYVINAVRMGATLNDAAYKDGILYLGLRGLFANEEFNGIYNIYENGYARVFTMSAVLEKDNTCNGFYRCTLQPSNEERALIAVVFGEETAMTAENTALFRLDYASGEVELAGDAQTAEAWLKQAVREQTAHAVSRVSDTIEEEQTLQHVTVYSWEISFENDGSMSLFAHTYGLRCGNAGWYYRPRIYLDGVALESADYPEEDPSSLFTDPDMIWLEDSQEEGWYLWRYTLPDAYAPLPEQMNVRVEWELYDATPAHEKISVGPFVWERTLTIADLPVQNAE